MIVPSMMMDSKSGSSANAANMRVMPQPVKVDGVLMAARNRRRTRHHHLEHRVPHPVRIPPIRHRRRKPPAHPEPAFRRSQQQQTAIRRLIAAVKINGELRWTDGRSKGSSVASVGGCGPGLIHDAIRSNTDLLRESLVSCHSRLSIPHHHA
jgi:hypothetical protein